MKKIDKLLSLVSPEAYIMLRVVLGLCVLLLLSSLALLLHIGALTPATYALYRLAAELQNTSAAVLLLGNIAALLLEEIGSKR